MTNNILITGATGFIGSHLLEKLSEKKTNVIILKRSFSNTWRIHDIMNKNNEKIKTFDIDNIKIQDIFDSYDVEGIFHLAASYIKKPSHENIKTMIETNINFPTELLDTAVSNNLKFFINTGTYFEYSWDKLPLTEQTTKEPRDFYSTSKVSFENILKYYSREYSINSSTLKLFTPYGSKDDENKIIPYLIIRTLKNEEVNIMNPQNQLNTVHVDDIVSAYLQIYEKIHSLNEYEVFNIANEYTHSIDEIYSTILEIMGKTNKIKENSDANMHVDTSKTRTILDWKTKTNLKDGLKKTIDYYRNNIN